MSHAQTPPPVAQRRPRLAAALIGFGMLVLIVVPAAFGGFLAIISFTGCLLGCSEPTWARGEPV